MRKHEKNLTQGALLPQLLAFALPLLATNVILRSFGAADTAVLGKFASKTSVAAVGATGSVTSLLLGFFSGLTVSSNVMVSRAAGTGDRERAARTVGCSICCGIVFGILLAVVGVFCAYPLLRLINCPEEIIDQAATYIKIYFLGMPIILLFNFAAAILRAVGDSFRPGAYLSIGGILNIGLNILFVLAFKLDVAGVALATIIGQLIPTSLVIIALFRADGFSKLDRKHLRFYKTEFCDILKIGLPIGVQSCIAALSSGFVSSSLNSLGTDVVEAQAVGGTIDGYVYVCVNSVSSAVPAFVSQNYGAGNIKRLKKSVTYALFLDVAVGAVIGTAVALCGAWLCGLFTSNEAAIELATMRLRLIAPSYLLAGIMEIYANALRSLNKSAVASLVVLVGNCLVSVVWILTVFRAFNTYLSICFASPVAWIAASAILAPVYYIAARRIPEPAGKPEKAESSEPSLS